MNGWDREYLQNKDSYQLLFDNIMVREQEASVEFLEESIKKIEISFTQRFPLRGIFRNVILCSSVGYYDLISNFLFSLL